MTEIPVLREREVVPLASLRPHPDNYRRHPADQLDHLRQSLREHGVYRNVVVAQDGTILAGHGVVEAAVEEGLTEIPVVRLPVDPDDVKARKLLAADNELSHLSVSDDRALAELLRSINEDDLDGLLGTGYDEAMLANLVYVTRPETEVGDRNDAAAWVGLPEYEQLGRAPQLIINFDDETERDVVLAKLGITAIHSRQRRVWSVWFPPREREDRLSVAFEETG
jgi:ParB-like chromosome segregation protein Spo0J